MISHRINLHCLSAAIDYLHLNCKVFEVPTFGMPFERSVVNHGEINVHQYCKQQQHIPLRMIPLK